MRRLLFAILSVLLAVTSCSRENGSTDGLVVTALNFPSYDAARAVLGENADLRMLIPPGAEVHSYEPSPEDVIRIIESDLFIYTGGESDEWIDGILDELDHVRLFSLISHSPVVYDEEHVEGMQEEAHAHEADISGSDEHVWTSLENMAAIVSDLKDEIILLDPESSSEYEANASAYISSILSLKDDFSKLRENSARNLIVVADRFPFLYFAREFGLEYYAAFAGCASGTEPSAKTVAFLIDTVRREGIPVVMHIELSNTMLAEVVADETGAEVMELNSAQNISLRDFNSGKTYLDIMRDNYVTLKEALN